MCDKAEVTMVLYADGCPHPGKIDADKIMKEERDEKHSQFGDLQKNQKNGSPSYESNKGRISKLMKQSSYRREGIMFNIKSWCESENICLIGAPFETDLQEVGD
jgi:hypothetical protein